MTSQHDDVLDALADRIVTADKWRVFDDVESDPSASIPKRKLTKDQCIQYINFFIKTGNPNATLEYKVRAIQEPERMEVRYHLIDRQTKQPIFTITERELRYV